MADASASKGSAQDTIILVIKNPAKSFGDNFQLQLSPSCTIQQVKERLKESYDGHPATECQTLIYCGRVLRDASETLEAMIKNHVQAQGGSLIHTLHLVVKQPAAESASSPAPQRPAPREAQPMSSTGAAALPPQPATSRPSTPAAAVASAVPDSQPAAAAAPAPRSQQPPASPASSPSSTQSRQTEVPQAAAHPFPLPQQPQGQQVPPSANSGMPYYMMNPVMAAAYQAALAALVGSSPAEAAPLDMQMPQIPAMPFPAMHPMATFMNPVGMQHMHPNPQQPMQGAANANQNQHRPAFLYGPYAYPQNPDLPAGPYGAGPYMPYGPGPYMLAPQQPPQGVGRWYNPAPQAGAAAPGARFFPPQQQQQQQQAQDPAAAAIAAAVAGEAPGGNNGRQIRVRLIRLDIRMLLQLGVFALILYQHCSPTRFFMLLFGGLALYLTALVPMRRALQNLVTGNGAARQGAGFLREVQMIFVGFIASLLPGWNFNPDDAAAFQAAQEMVAAEGAAQNNNRGREHQD